MAKKRITPKSQYPAMNAWKRKNMKSVSCMYKKEFVEEFKEACTKLGIAQSDVIRKAMNDTINLANGKVENKMTLEQVKKEFGIREFDELKEEHPRAFKYYDDAKKMIDEKFTSRESAFVISKNETTYKVEEAKPMFDDGDYLEVANVEIMRGCDIKVWMHSTVTFNDEGEVDAIGSDYIGWSE